MLIKKTFKCQIAKIFQGFTPNPIGDLLSKHMRGLQSRTPNPLLQSSEIPNLGLMAQIGNFWLTPWWHIRKKIIQTIKNPSTLKSTKMTPNYWVNSGKWKLQKKSQSCVENLGQYQLYNANTKQCLLCLNEKLQIPIDRGNNILNWNNQQMQAQEQICLGKL